MFPSLFGSVDILIIFNIIKNNQVWSPVPVPSITDFLSAAYCLNLDIAGSKNNISLPNLSLKLTTVFNYMCVFFKLGLNIGKESLCLVGALRKDNRYKKRFSELTKVQIRIKMDSIEWGG